MLQMEIELEQTTILINLCDFKSIKSQNLICTIKDSYLSLWYMLKLIYII